MKAVTLHHTVPFSQGNQIWEQHYCGENAGYECPGTRSTYDIEEGDWPLIRIWGDQGTYWAPMDSLVGLSFQEKLEKCPVCSGNVADSAP